MMNSRDRRDPAGSIRTGGFTLPDSLATCVALLVLVACFVPATAGVARTSKEARCLSNLARIGHANLVYAAQDPTDAALPVHPMQYRQCGPSTPPGEVCDEPIHVGAYEWGGKSGRGWAGFFPGPDGDLAFLASKYGTYGGFGPASRPLNDILYPGGFEDHLNPWFDRNGAVEDTQLDLDFMRCPSDVGYTGVHFPTFRDEKLTSYDHFGTSYTANVFATANSGGGEIMSNSPYLRQMSNLMSPVTTVAFMENNGRYAWSAEPDQCEFIEGVPGKVRGWHGRDWMFNTAFADGHVDSIYMRGYRNPKVFEDDRLQEISRCIIIRGDNWQLDTLPLPSVRTRLLHSGFLPRPSWEHGIE